MLCFASLLVADKMYFSSVSKKKQRKEFIITFLLIRLTDIIKFTPAFISSLKIACIIKPSRIQQRMKRVYRVKRDTLYSTYITIARTTAERKRVMMLEKEFCTGFWKHKFHADFWCLKIQMLGYYQFFLRLRWFQLVYTGHYMSITGLPKFPIQLCYINLWINIPIMRHFHDLMHVFDPEWISENMENATSKIFRIFF